MIDRSALRELMTEVEADRGPFTLFALLKREHAPGVWDLVVAAPWMDRDESGALRDIIEKLVAKIGEKRLLDFSRVVILRWIDDSLQAILRDVGTVNRPVERTGEELFGLPVEQAYIFRARRPKAAACRVDGVSADAASAEVTSASRTRRTGSTSGSRAGRDGRVGRRSGGVARR